MEGINNMESCGDNKSKYYFGSIAKYLIVLERFFMLFVLITPLTSWEFAAFSSILCFTSLLHLAIQFTTSCLFIEKEEIVIANGVYYLERMAIFSLASSFLTNNIEDRREAAYTLIFANGVRVSKFVLFVVHKIFDHQYDFAVEEEQQVKNKQEEEASWTNMRAVATVLFWVERFAMFLVIQNPDRFLAYALLLVTSYMYFHFSEFCTTEGESEGELFYIERLGIVVLLLHFLPAPLQIPSITLGTAFVLFNLSNYARVIKFFMSVAQNFLLSKRKTVKLNEETWQRKEAEGQNYLVNDQEYARELADDQIADDEMELKSNSKSVHGESEDDISSEESYSWENVKPDDENDEITNLSSEKFGDAEIKLESIDDEIDEITNFSSEKSCIVEIKLPSNDDEIDESTNLSSEKSWDHVKLASCDDDEDDESGISWDHASSDDEDDESMKSCAHASNDDEDESEADESSIIEEPSRETELENSMKLLLETNKTLKHENERLIDNKKAFIDFYHNLGKEYHISDELGKELRSKNCKLEEEKKELHEKLEEAYESVECYQRVEKDYIEERNQWIDEMKTTVNTEENINVNETTALLVADLEAVTERCQYYSRRCFELNAQLAAAHSSQLAQRNLTEQTFRQMREYNTDDCCPCCCNGLPLSCAVHRGQLC